MPSSSRYQQIEVQEHLASQYALGALSPRCKRRVERLIPQIPELERRVQDWQQKIIPLTSPAHHSSQAQKNNAPFNTTANTFNGIQSCSKPIFLWKGCSLLLCILFVATLISPKLWPVPATLQPVNYMASLQASQPYSLPLLVATIYQGTHNASPQLHLQWNDRLNSRSTEALSLWITDRENGNRVSLGPINRSMPSRGLSKSEWQAITDSAELLVIQGPLPEGTIVLRGPCIKLTP